ncbi:MAG TPA: serine/threonine-protein kinase, partial [Methylibium sp.]
MSSIDEDRTLIKPAPAERGNALPAGTRLAEFEILSVIGEGGFGIVYLAQDHSLGRQVAIKEYMPAALAARTRALTVSVLSQRHAETFAAGLRSFINEARLLAQFDHPALLKVYRFWEAHGTAYMVMPYYAGITLSQTLKRLKASPDEARLRALLHQLLDALELMHAARCYHRDISPDNILIQPDGRPLLLDFGAARRVIGDMTRALTVILKTGYAPVEQYGEMPELKQGPWTDLYALASVVHYAIMGNTPPPSIQRYLNDKFVPLSRAAAGRYSPGFLQAMDRALAVLPKDRPQSAAELDAMLGKADRSGPAVGPVRAAAGMVPHAAYVTGPATPVASSAEGLAARPQASPATAGVDILLAAPERAAAPAARQRLVGLMLGAAAVIALGVVALTYVRFERSSGPATASTATTSSESPTNATPTVDQL